MPNKCTHLQKDQYLPLDTTVIGLTGPLSSGVSTVAGFLKEKGFVLRRLSDVIRQKLASKGIHNPTPQQLQNKGDELRKSLGASVLVQMCLEGLGAKTPNKIAIDGLRNPGEVQYLRRFSKFYLVAIDSPQDERLKRYRVVTGENIPDQEFYNLDERDSGKNQPPYGQNVTACIDLADFQIINDRPWDRDLTIKDQFFKKIETLLSLIEEPGSKFPSPREIGMHFAYSASLMSPCLKRQVGSTIAKEVGPKGQELAIAIGYNRPPDGINSCLDRFRGCYRDFLKKSMDGKLRKELKKRGYKKGTDEIIEAFLSYPDVKRLDYCQSIHAEESAILQVAKLGGNSLSGTTLYTTTFPCLLCAKKIIQTGISRIVYNEAYPIQEAKDLLMEALRPDNLIRFEGVKALAFLSFSNRIENRGWEKWNYVLNAKK
jgi:deoxycytidylate deaminase